MQTHVEFRSALFSPYEGEETNVNPGMWGKRLAEFIRDGLRTKGIEAEEPFLEDWGWVVTAAREPFHLWIGCGHYQKYADGYICFIEPHSPYVRKFLSKIETGEHLMSLHRALDEVLSQCADIRSKRWWTHEEFNMPPKQDVKPNPGQ